MPEATQVDATPALRPQPATLEGRHVRLAPLDATHADALFAQANGPTRDDLWRYLQQAPFADIAGFRAHIENLAASPDAVFFAVFDRRRPEPLGYASYMRIEPQQRVVEVGNILFTPPLQRTVAATEAMYLMARHVFEDLGYRRYEWKCNVLNAPSRRAAERLGFTFEGIFRQHMIVKGLNRDTAWYAMLDGDWPHCRAAFEAWLAPDNFDDDGRQRRSLASIRATL